MEASTLKRGMLDGLTVKNINGINQRHYERWGTKIPHFYKYWKKREWLIYDRDVRCIILGYAESHAGDTYHMYNPSTKQIHLSRNLMWMRQMFLQLDGYRKIQPISSKTPQKYILSLMPLLERVIAEQLPGKFGLLLDGWTAGTVHYVALFALYVNTVGTHKEHLLALAPLINVEKLGAQQYVEFIEAT